MQTGENLLLNKQVIREEFRFVLMTTLRQTLNDIA